MARQPRELLIVLICVMLMSGVVPPGVGASSNSLTTTQTDTSARMAIEEVNNHATVNPRPDVTIASHTERTAVATASEGNVSGQASVTVVSKSVTHVGGPAPTSKPKIWVSLVSNSLNIQLQVPSDAGGDEEEEEDDDEDEEEEESDGDEEEDEGESDEEDGEQDDDEEGEERDDEDQEQNEEEEDGDQDDDEDSRDQDDGNEEEDDGDAEIQQEEGEESDEDDDGEERDDADQENDDDGETDDTNGEERDDDDGERDGSDDETEDDDSDDGNVGSGVANTYDLTQLGATTETEWEITVVVEEFEPDMLVGTAKLSEWSFSTTENGNTKITIRGSPIEKQLLVKSDGTIPTYDNWPTGADDQATAGVDAWMTATAVRMDNAAMAGGYITTDANSFSSPIIKSSGSGNDSKLVIDVAGPHLTVNGQQNTGFYTALIPNSLLNTWGIESASELAASYQGSNKAFSATRVDDGIKISFDIHYSNGTVSVGPGEGNIRPTASFNYTPTEPTPNESIRFDATNTTDSDGSIQSYEWDFDGDGTVDTTGATVTHSFPTAGDRQVQLTVTDNDNGTHSMTKTVSVATNRSGTTGTTVSVTPRSVNTDMSSTRTVDIVVANASSGIGTVNITISSGNTSVATITAVDYKGSAAFFTPEFAADNSSLSLNGGAAEIDGPGETTVATITIQTHSPGSTDLTLTVTDLADKDGNAYTVTDTKPASVTVRNRTAPPPVAGGGDNAGGGQAKNPTDTDGDGKYEDVDGSGDLGFNDLTVFFANLNSDTIKNNKEFFDYDGNGEVTINDLTQLFTNLQQSG